MSDNGNLEPKNQDNLDSGQQPEQNIPQNNQEPVQNENNPPHSENATNKNNDVTKSTKHLPQINNQSFQKNNEEKEKIKEEEEENNNNLHGPTNEIFINDQKIDKSESLNQKKFYFNRQPNIGGNVPRGTLIASTNKFLLPNQRNELDSNNIQTVEQTPSLEEEKVNTSTTALAPIFAPS